MISFNIVQRTARPLFTNLVLFASPKLTVLLPSSPLFQKLSLLLDVVLEAQCIK